MSPSPLFPPSFSLQKNHITPDLSRRHGALPPPCPPPFQNEGCSISFKTLPPPKAMKRGPPPLPPLPSLFSSVDVCSRVLFFNIDAISRSRRRSLLGSNVWTFPHSSFLLFDGTGTSFQHIPPPSRHIDSGLATPLFFSFPPLLIKQFVLVAGDRDRRPSAPPSPPHDSASWARYHPFL